VTPARVKKRPQAQDSEQVPSGQPPQLGTDAQESHVAPPDDFPCPTAKPDSSLLILPLPHFSHVGLAALRFLVSTSITWPHCSHLYSKIGIVH